MSLVLPIIPSQLPQGFCPPDYQSMWNGYAAHGSVTIPDGSLGGVQVSASKPTDQTRPWLQLDQFGRPVRLYWFAQGSWLSLHPLPPGATIWWFDVLPTFTTFDGGDTAAASALSGPMWQAAKLPNGTAIAAQFPLVAGTLPSGLVLNAGDTGGEEKHVLTGPELPSTTNTNNVQGVIDKTDNIGAVVTSGAALERLVATPIPNISQGADQGHNTMGPYAVGYMLQRTTRLFYAV